MDMIFNSNDSDDDECISICHRLRMNDPTLIDLIIKEPRMIHSCPNLNEFCISLSNNTIVQSIYIGGLTIRMTNEDDICQLIEACRTIRSLQKLEINIPDENALLNKRITANSLAQLIDHCSTIQSIIIWPFVWFQNMNDIILLSNALRNHPSLQTIAFMHILMSNNNNNNNNQRNQNNENENDDGDDDEVEKSESTSSSSMLMCLDPVLESLATIPNLRNLQLSAGMNTINNNRNNDNNNNNSNNNIISKQYIQDIQYVQNLLQYPCNLQYLALRNFSFTVNDCYNITNTLSEQKNSTALTVLDIRSYNQNYNCNPNVLYELFYNMLQDNYTLHWLELFHDDDQQLQIFNKNRQCKQIWNNIEFLLRINQAGRNKLMKQFVSREECIEIIISTSSTNNDDDNNNIQNLDVLYYLLRCNPSSWL